MTNSPLLFDDRHWEMSQAKWRNFQQPLKTWNQSQCYFYPLLQVLFFKVLQSSISSSFLWLLLTLLKIFVRVSEFSLLQSKHTTFIPSKERILSPSIVWVAFLFWMCELIRKYWAHNLTQYSLINNHEKYHRTSLMFVKSRMSMCRCVYYCNTS
jgi:hypothetical protein